MLRSMYSGVTGLRAHQTKMDVIGNNIANVNTAGFKSSRAIFQDVFYQTIANATSSTANKAGTNPKQIGYGTTVSSIDVQHTRSGYLSTDLPLDMYINGDGYFTVRDGAGNTFYTRVGNFSFDADGYLSDANGNYVLGASSSPTTPATLPTTVTAADIGRIQILNYSDYTNISIGSNGIISGVSAASGQVVELGQVTLANFINPKGLTQIGTQYVQESSNSGVASYSAPASANTASLVSGGLEMSNVDLSREFTEMITTQRGFQANSRVITTSDEILQELVNLKR